MDYASALNTKLKPKPNGAPLVLDLFAGCGGLSLGFEAEGFTTHGFEMESDFCETYQRNLLGSCECVKLTPDTPLPPAQIVVGGPPCQPFSVGGHQMGLKDSRDGFPIFISAIERLQPDIWIFENVRGLLYSNRWYFEEVIAALQKLNYIVQFELLNAVHFGVPQNRERVIVVGHRGNFRFPIGGHSKVTVADALGEMLVQTPPESKYLTPSMDTYVAKYEKASFCIRPRDLHPDIPARTLTCRNLAGATGDMHRIRLPDGRRRRLLIHEAARLQSFPDWFEFSGGETSQFNQIGNAVAPLFASHLAASVRAYLDSAVRYSSPEILYRSLPNQLDLPLAVASPQTLMIPQLYTTKAKPEPANKLINEALYILLKLGIPLGDLTPRRLEMLALCFLAVADVKPRAGWSDAKDSTGEHHLKSREIIEYLNEHFAEKISRGSYDDIRRVHLRLPVAAGIVIRSSKNPNAARNDPTRGYALAPDFAGLIRRFGEDGWESEVEEFLAERPTLAEQLDPARDLARVPVTLPGGRKLMFSPGEHNELQRAVIEQFLPIYGHGAEVLYVGDAADKFLCLETERLRALQFFEIAHGELPDVIAYSSDKNWLYLIEAVHSFGPISPVRLLELQKLTRACTAEIVYVTAFLRRDTFRKFAPEIAWETEVWIAEAPEHLIHFDGHRFLGPYPRKTKNDAKS